jgi:hypothetical protein
MSEDRDKLSENDELELEDDDVEAHSLGGRDSDRENSLGGRDTERENSLGGRDA